MKKKNIVIITLILIFEILINFKFSYAQKEVDVFEEMIKECNGVTEEYGIKTCFETEDEGEMVCNDILKKMGLYNGTGAVMNVLKNENTYCIEFKRNTMQGYVQSLKNDKKNAIIISISDKGQINKLQDLKKIIKIAIEDRESKPKYFQYLKSKIPSSNLNEENQRLLKILKKYNATNVETVNIQSGFTTVANTKQYEAIRNNGKWMDFNYAICNYSSGSYLIIGTPIINISY